MNELEEQTAEEILNNAQAPAAEEESATIESVTPEELIKGDFVNVGLMAAGACVIFSIGVRSIIKMFKASM